MFKKKIGGLHNYWLSVCILGLTPTRIPCHSAAGRCTSYRGTWQAHGCPHRRRWSPAPHCQGSKNRAEGGAKAKHLTIVRHTTFIWLRNHIIYKDKESVSFREIFILISEKEQNRNRLQNKSTLSSTTVVREDSIKLCVCVCDRKVYLHFLSNVFDESHMFIKHGL